MRPMMRRDAPNAATARLSSVSPWCWRPRAPRRVPSAARAGFRRPSFRFPGRGTNRPGPCRRSGGILGAGFDQAAEGVNRRPSRAMARP
jgi:hypothetical protein